MVATANFYLWLWFLTRTDNWLLSTGRGNKRKMAMVAAAPAVPMPSPTYESEEFVNSEGTFL